MSTSSISQLSVNALRALSIDMVQAANSGHPGAPLGMAPMAYALWQRLRHDPARPGWRGRDRFVLSAGHASALLYSLMHLTGYENMSLDELKNFRQWNSQTPGHPEFLHSDGLDSTTGPLGQGIAMTVGMAMAEAHLADRFNEDGHEVIDNFTYAICGDGDLQEGVSHEAASLAGHLGLGKLIWLHDDNSIQLDTPVSEAEDTDVAARFASYGWQVLRVEDGNDLEAIAAAIAEAEAELGRPSLIQVKTVIGHASPRAGTSKAHGEPLGEEGVSATKAELGWSYAPFEVPAEVRDHMNAHARGAALHAAWEKRLQAYEAAFPEKAAELEAILSGQLPDLWADLPTWAAGDKAQATRNASGEIINALAERVPALLGGSADVSGSTKTTINGSAHMKASEMAGRNVRFGVREFGMAAAANGMSLYGGLRPLVGTFMVFSDYLKPALRLSALQMQGVIYVLSHDSVGLGEDGPTHQPIEQLAMLRAIPNTVTLRPADANETAAAWAIALERKDGPTALILSRQNLDVLPANHDGVKKGAYVVREAQGAQVTLLATGSEVGLALQSAEALAKDGIAARVVSMPSFELFREQSAEYRREVLGTVPRVAIEAAASQPWYEWLGEERALVTLDRFGASAPGEEVLEKLGFSVENVGVKVRELLKA